MADKDVAYAAFLLNLSQEFCYTVLYRHIESTGSFIADDDFRL